MRREACGSRWPLFLHLACTVVFRKALFFLCTSAVQTKKQNRLVVKCITCKCVSLYCVWIGFMQKPNVVVHCFVLKTFSMDMTNSSMVLENLEAGMNYCVRVHLRIRINPHTWPSRCVYASTSDPEPSMGKLQTVLKGRFWVIIIRVSSTVYCVMIERVYCRP